MSVFRNLLLNSIKGEIESPVWVGDATARYDKYEFISYLGISPCFKSGNGKQYNMIYCLNGSSGSSIPSVSEESLSEVDDGICDMDWWDGFWGEGGPAIRYAYMKEEKYHEGAKLYTAIGRGNTVHLEVYGDF